MRFPGATIFLTTAFSTTTKPSIAFAAIPSISALPSPAFLHGHRNLSSRRTTRTFLPFSPTSTPSVADSSFGSFSPSTQRHSFNNITKRSMSSKSSTGPASGGGKVALLQFKVSASKSENQQKVKELIDSTMKENPSTKLIVLPEIWNGPYATAAFAEYAEVLPPLDYSYSTNEDDMEDYGNMEHICPSAKVLFDAAMKYGIYIIGGSIAEKENGLIYNTCLCISPDGTLVAKHRKVHLFDIDVKGGITFKESDTLTGGDTVSVFDTGDELFGSIGVGICYDIRFPEYALLLTQKHKCNLLVYPGAFNLTTGPAHWELLQRGRAVDNQCFVLTASPARTEPPKEGEESKYPHYTAWGHSTVVNPWGEVIATCDEKEAVVMADLNIEEVKNMRQGIPTSSQKRLDLYKLEEGGKKKQPGEGSIYASQT